MCSCKSVATLSQNQWALKPDPAAGNRRINLVLNLVLNLVNGLHTHLRISSVHFT